ncbi:MAG: hypothetical protein PVI99_03010 [Anaerolineales bacterium]
MKDNKWILVPMVIAIFLASFAFAPQAQAAGPACWGQASAVFAQMGEMGEHSSEQPTPRDGLRNLARYLFNEGIILDDSMAALGAFVADALGLSIDACM